MSDNCLLSVPVQHAVDPPCLDDLGMSWHPGASGTCRYAAPHAYGGQLRPSLRDRQSRPSGLLVQETATGIRPASIHAGMPNADPSPSGGSLRSRRCLFRLISAPRILWGAEMAGWH
jgi:hypothetical protein